MCDVITYIAMAYKERTIVRDAALLGARLVLGGYLAAHGAQKLFGSFGGHGLDGTGAFFDAQGLTPGRDMARVAGLVEMGSGALTATGMLAPLGPVAAAGAMAVAVPFHRAGGPLAANGGYEPALTNLALAAALAVAGPGRWSVPPRLPGKLVGAVVAGAAISAGYLVSRVLRHEATQVAAGEPAAVEIDISEGGEGATPAVSRDPAVH